jgi:transcriptional regulator with XRE-family HTH domain
MDLKELRIEHGLLLKQVEAGTGLSMQCIAHYELGRREPNINGLCALAEFYKVTIDVIVNCVKQSKKNYGRKK